MIWLTDLDTTLRAEGCRVSENDGWRTRGIGGLLGVRGVLCHHTAGGGDADDWVTVQNGKPGLTGPLAQMTLERDGTFRLIAAGLAQHAGKGSHPAIGTDNGNSWLIGIEGVSRGVGDWTPEQRAAYPRGVAALLRHYGLGADRAIFHREWAPLRKIDPAGFDGPAFRADVDRILRTEPPTKGIPTMIDRALVAGSNTGTVIVPTGSASSIVEAAWVSVRTDGGGHVRVWFQKSAAADGSPPGAGQPWDVKYQNAERAWAPIPDGTEYLMYEVDAAGPGALAVELKAK